MAIIKMKKFELFSLDNRRTELLEGLQKFKFVHFIKTDFEDSENLQEIEESNEVSSLREENQKLKWMIDFLKVGNSRKKMQAIDFNEMEKRAKKYDFQKDFLLLENISKEQDANNQELTSLKNKKQELRDWMQIKEPLENLKKFQRAKLILGTVPTKILPVLEERIEPFTKTYFEKISGDLNSVNLLFLIAESEKNEVMEILKNSGFTEVNFSFLGSFRDEIEKVESREKEIKENNKKLEEQIKILKEKLPDMEVKKEYIENIILRNDVSGHFRKTDFVDVIQGYIPASLETKFKRIVADLSKNKSYLKIYEVDSEDPEVPIILKNSKIFSLFESITQMYALPRYSELDPTPMLSIFYWIFFGMMVADFAYGLILCLGSAIALYFCKFSETTKKFIKFFFALSFSTMIWGLIYGSAFGDLIHLPTQILDPSKDFMSILILSIIFGGIHLIVALGMKAYVLIKNGHIMDAFYDVFLWYLTLTSVILLILSNRIGLSAYAKNVISILTVIGMLGIVAFSARDAKSLAGRIGGGLYSLYGITSYIGDFVSYLRLMALGLAGGFIAVAINIIVKKLAETGIIGLLFGIIIFAFGQTFNIFLSLLSAYVHTSRLMYVEFFSKFYEGGGKAFRKFRVESQYFENEVREDLE
ncbi:V-type ATP synthase subunit I [Fusobacterium russii]|uniref:V-type ATP synthase subunit I n=1 Tax=Fusobacterium russii TaxID=854 RepID=UPI0003A1EC77|nr:V-type ATP synthase subunit I [Fusobacterium russii]